MLHQTADDSPVFPSPVETLHTEWTKHSFWKSSGVSVSACYIPADHLVPESELYEDGHQMAGRKGTSRKIEGPMGLLLLSTKEFFQAECSL